MKRLILLILLSLMTYSQSVSEWNKVYNLDLLRFQDINCADELNCMSISFEYVMKTTDGGYNWFIQQYDPTLKVYDDDGKVIKTIPPKFKSRICLDYVTPDFAVMGHQTGQVSITRDGGTTWDSVSLGATRDIRSIQFLDENYGMVFATNSDIFKTTNGGHDWEKVQLSYKEEFTTSEINISLVGKDSMIVVVLDGTDFSNQYYKTVRTTDGGITWESGNEIPLEHELYPYFISINEGWLAGGDRKSIGTANAVIFYTFDGGMSWDKQMDTVLSPHSGLNHIYFSNTNEGIAYNNRTILRTSNGGINWFVDESYPELSQGGDLIAKLGFPKLHTKKIIAVGLGLGHIWLYEDLTSVNEDVIKLGDINIYPNPTNEFITIQLSNKGLQPFASGDKVQILDMLGMEIMSESIHPMTGSHRMNIEKLPAGVYFIRIGTCVEKFVKM